MNLPISTTILFSMVLFSQISFGTSATVKSQNSSELIQQAKQMRVSIREHLKSIGKRLNMTQVMRISGSFSGLLSSGSISGQGFEILRETEWYYIETMRPINIEAIEARLISLVNEYTSSVSGQWSIPSRKISNPTKHIIAEIKAKRSTVASPESLSDLKNKILAFSQIMQELEVRTLSAPQQESLKELAKWGTTTVLVNRDFNLSNVQLGDDYDLIRGDGGYLVINGISFGAYSGYSLESVSVVTPTVLY